MGSSSPKAKRTKSQEAYEAYLKGLFHLYQFSPQALDTALEYFQLALEKDPNYALAHTGIAFVWAGRVQYGYLSPREGYPKAKAAAVKAVEIDDTLAEAHDLLATALTWYEWDWPAAEREFRRAIQLTPNYANARAFYSLLLASIGRRQEAMAEIQQCVELDPLNFTFRVFMVGS